MRERKVLRHVRHLREEEFLPPGDPSRSYHRQFRKTRMHWMLALIYQKRTDVLFVVIFAIAAFVLAIGFILYLFLHWVLTAAGVI